MVQLHAPKAVAYDSGSVSRQRHQDVSFRTFAFVEALILLLLAVLTVAVKVHQGPLVGDVGGELKLQHWLRPHQQVTNLLDLASTINWPIPSAITVASVAVLLLVLRRWLDVAVLLILDALGNGVDFFFSHWIHRARPSGHGIYVARSVTSSFSFPSGHVLQAVILFGFLLFLTFQVQRRPAVWLWPIRALLVFLILAMGPSRILEGEHWPSDVLAGVLYGCFWLFAGIQAYRLLRQSRPEAR